MSEEIVDLNKVENALSNYSLTDAKIAELGELINPVEITDAESRKSAGIHAKVMRDHRNGLEEFRTDHKRILKRAGEKLDAEAKLIQSKMDPIEKGIKDKMKAWDDRKAEEKAEKERLEQERETLRIDTIKQAISDNLHMNPLTIDAIDVVQLAVIHQTISREVVDQETYQEFSSEAIDTRNESLKLITATIDKIGEAVEAARILKEREDAAEEQRLENQRVADENARKQRDIEAENKRVSDELAADQKLIDARNAEMLAENMRMKSALDAKKKEIDDAADEVAQAKQKVINEEEAAERKKTEEADRVEFEKNAADKAEADAIKRLLDEKDLKAKEEAIRVKALSNEKLMEEYISRVGNVEYPEFKDDEPLTSEILTIHMKNLETLDIVLAKIRSLIVTE